MNDYAFSPEQLEVIDALSGGADRAARRSRILKGRGNQGELAIETLRKLLADPNTPAGVRLKTALAVIQPFLT